MRIFFLFSFSALVLSAQGDLTGLWVLRIPDGGLTFFDLKQSGSAVTGTLPGSSTKLTGTVTGHQVHLSTVSSTRSRKQALIYDGTLQSDRITVAVEDEHGHSSHGVMERTTREEIFPPRLALPQLRDVPDNGLARTPPMGWNSWNKFQETITDAIVRETADAMVSSGMKEAGYNYVVVDEGWSSARDSQGNIIGNAKFPDMKALAGYLHAKGLKAGIYSSPGPQACGGYQGSYGHEEQDARTFAEWGYDYLKYDWCTTNRIYGSTREESQALSQKMGEALLQTGRPMIYSIHSMGEVWIWGPAAGANLWRTTNDIADTWESMDRIGFAQLDIAAQATPGHWNDPDMLEVGNGGMNNDEYRSHMSLWALLAAPLMAGNDVRTLTEETKTILLNSEVIAIDQDRAARPVQRLNREGLTEVLVRPLRDSPTTRFGAEHSAAVGLFNRGEQIASASFTWDDLHLGAVLGAKVLRARDLWKHEDVAVSGHRYTVQIPPHGVVLLKVSAVPTR